MTIKNNSSCAVFLTADPLTNVELQVVKEAKKIYEHVDIILDRKSRENTYKLNFDIRAEIIKHDFKDNSIDDYNIYPNDETLCRTLKKLDIHTLIVGMSASIEPKILKKVKFMHQISDNLTIVAIPTFSTCSSDMIDMILKEDLSKDLLRKYMSDYAFMKAKLALTRKIGIAGDSTSKSEIVLSAFADRSYDYDIVNLDLLKSKEWLSFIIDTLRSSCKKAVVLYSKDYFAKGVNKICDLTVCIYSNPLDVNLQESMKKSDMYVDAKGDEKSTFRNAINLINHRL